MASAVVHLVTFCDRTVFARDISSGLRHHEPIDWGGEDPRAALVARSAGSHSETDPSRPTSPAGRVARGRGSPRSSRETPGDSPTRHGEGPDEIDQSRPSRPASDRSRRRRARTGHRRLRGDRRGGLRPRHPADRWRRVPAGRHLHGDLHPAERLQPGRGRRPEVRERRRDPDRAPSHGRGQSRTAVLECHRDPDGRAGVDHVRVADRGRHMDRRLHPDRRRVGEPSRRLPAGHPPPTEGDRRDLLGGERPAERLDLGHTSGRRPLLLRGGRLEQRADPDRRFGLAAGRYLHGDRLPRRTTGRHLVDDDRRRRVHDAATDGEPAHDDPHSGG